MSVDGIEKLALYRNGGGPNRYSHVWSVTKSVVSTLVGIAISEGKIRSLDSTLAELLPGHAKQMSSMQRSVTLRQLLPCRLASATDTPDPDPPTEESHPS